MPYFEEVLLEGKISDDLKSVLEIIRQERDQVSQPAAKAYLDQASENKFSPNFKQSEFFTSIMDEVSILHLVNDDAPYISILVAGILHTSNVSKILENQLNYSVVEEFGRPFGQLTRLDFIYFDKTYMNNAIEQIFLRKDDLFPGLKK